MDSRTSHVRAGGAQQADDPRGLIQKYCEITGQLATSQLPHGVSFSRMIDTILNYEAAGEKRPVATR